MFQWLRAIGTMAILMVVAFLIARTGSDLYDKYNSTGLLGLLGLLMIGVVIISILEEAWKSLRHSRARRTGSVEIIPPERRRSIRRD